MRERINDTFRKIKHFTIKPWERTVRACFYKIAAFENAIISALVIFFPIEEKYRLTLFICFIIALLLSYLAAWIFANAKKSISFKIGKTKVVIEQGDLFREDGLKVIAANTYFDTHVGDNIIDPQSLHGIFIKKYYGDSTETLDRNIVNSLPSSCILSTDEKRPAGKKIQYKLGTIYNDPNGFLLVAYARFDDNNRAYLEPDDVMNCYMNMWNEIDKYRGNASICLPVLGSGGLVRNLYNRYTTQQLIELILGTFRASGITLSRNAKLKIIVYGNMVDEINFLKLRDYSD